MAPLMSSADCKDSAKIDLKEKNKKEVPSCLRLKPEDAVLMLRAKTHLGSEKCSASMKQYSYARRPDCVSVFNINHTWDKLVLAVRMIVAVENPADVLVVSSRKFGHRAVLKYAENTKAQAIAGKFTPGTLTNCQSKTYKEPRLVIVTDPMADSQVIRECSFVNVPVIAFCDSHTNLANIDVAIPCSNKSVHAIGLMWFFLAREVLYMRGSMPRSDPWDMMPDMFFYRDLDAEKAQEAECMAASAALAAASAAAAAAAAVVAVSHVGAGMDTSGMDMDGAWNMRDSDMHGGWAALDPPAAADHWGAGAAVDSVPSQWVN